MPGTETTGTESPGTEAPVDYEPVEDVVFRKMKTGGVLLRTATGAYFSVNEVGAAIWSALTDAAGSVDSLSAAVHDRFPDAPQNVADEVGAFLGELVERDLIRVAGAQNDAASQDS